MFVQPEKRERVKATSPNSRCEQGKELVIRTSQDNHYDHIN